VEWTSEFAIGIDQLDQQHCALVGMINALDASAHGEDQAATTRRMLAQLSDYVHEHFGFEERLMAGGGCSPELVSRHVTEHAHFRGVLKELTKDFESGRRNVTAALIDYLVHWLLHHIVVVDRAMALQFNAAEPKLAARVAAAMMQVTTGELSEAERHLLAELRRANQELQRQMDERTLALSERNRTLEAELRQMSALVERLSGAQEPTRAAD
jgi:hemerythrin